MVVATDSEEDAHRSDKEKRAHWAGPVLAWAVAVSRHQNNTSAGGSQRLEDAKEDKDIFPLLRVGTAHFALELIVSQATNLVKLTQLSPPCPERQIPRCRYQRDQRHAPPGREVAIASVQPTWRSLDRIIGKRDRRVGTCGTEARP